MSDRNPEAAPKSGPAESVGVLVQARMSSKRLPGKVLRPIAGTPLLGLLLERLGTCREVGPIAVATSSDESDDEVANFCRAQGISCHRGPLDDVAARMLEAAADLHLEAFVRISGDSPLLDPRLVDRAVALFRSDKPDIVTNVLTRTWPQGQSVEVVRRAVLANALPDFDQESREHVMPYFYARTERYNIVNIESRMPWGGINFTVDTRDDLKRIEAIMAMMDKPHWTYGVESLIVMDEEARRKESA